MNPLSLVCLFALSTTSCIGPSPSDLPVAEPYLVVVNSVRLPDYMQWYTRFAEHTWIDIKDGDAESWHRLEVSGQNTGVEIGAIPESDAIDPLRWDNRVSVLETLTGDEAQMAIPTLLHLAETEPDFGHSILYLHVDNTWTRSGTSGAARLYNAWPGPNSNTFVTALIDGTPELHAELHHNAVGKDYPRSFRAGRTSAGWGLELDTSYLGVGLGLRQGFELHLAGLTAGISLWPPALKLPLFPRLGIHQGWVGTAGN